MIAALRYLPILAIAAAAGAFIAIEPDRFLSLSIDWGLMTASVLLLYAFFWFRAWTWHAYLLSVGQRIGFRRALASVFLSVLTKYLPGKVWPILSMAAHVESRDFRFRDSVARVGWYQAAIILSGIGVGAIGLLAISNQHPALYPVPLLVIFLGVYLVGRSRLAGKLLHRFSSFAGLSIPREPPANMPLLLACVMHWVVMVAAYWLMFRSISVDIDPVVVLSQAMANVAGILVPFAPAGLGVREAAGAGYLATQIPDKASALVYVSLARAWSFIVELMVFLTGVVFRARL